MRERWLDIRVVVALGMAVILVAVSLVMGRPQPIHGGVPSFDAIPQVSTSDDGVVPAEAAEAIGGLWSPFCPGQMLEVCTSSEGAAVRDSIMVQARSGMESEAIIDFWVAEFGEEYRALPPMDGAGSFAWYTPYVMLLLGLALAWRLIPRRDEELTAAAVGPIAEADQNRLAAAMAELDRHERPDF